MGGDLMWLSHIYYEALEYFMYFLWNNSNTETCPSWNYEPFVISNKCRGAKKSHLTISLAILGQAITAKLAILVEMAWLYMAMNMVNSDFFANRGINVDQQWKWNWKRYGQNKIDTTFMVISYIFLALLRLEMAVRGATLPIGPQSSSLYFKNQCN